MVRPPLLFVNVLIVATCGLVYELLAGTIASYVLGDSVTQFSLVIGLYLSAMGIGAWLSGKIESRLAVRFVEIELAVALIGGLSAPLLFLSFAKVSFFTLLLYGKVVLIGALVGLELPLLMRLLKDQLEFKDVVSRVLTFDYLGALVASLLFPLFFVPKLGLVRTSLFFGLLNAGVAIWGTFLLAPFIPRGLGGLRLRGVAVAVLLVIGFVKADLLTHLGEDELYADPIVYTQTTPYQRIVLTQGGAGFQLFLSGNLQFSSADEYRYHEALVHPAMGASTSPRRVLVLGGGDGLAVREVLRHASVEEVTLVDLDPAMTGLAGRFPPLAKLANHALEDPRVTIVNEDAMLWLEEPRAPYDVAIVDFPDPNTYALGKLYTTRFYRLLRRALADDASIAVQATSPLFARSSYWCVIETLRAVGFTVHPYQTAVPSFGVWGFALAKASPFVPPQRAPEGLRFLNDETMQALFTLPRDVAPKEVEVNRLDNQVLVRYYESEWRRWN